MILGPCQIPGCVANTMLGSVEAQGGLNRSERALFIHHHPSHLPVNKPLKALWTRYQRTCQNDRLSTSGTHLVKQVQIYVLCSLQRKKSNICWEFICEVFFQFGKSDRWCVVQLFSVCLLWNGFPNCQKLVSCLLFNSVCVLGVLSCSCITL